MINDEILNSIDEILQKHRVFLVGGYLRDYYLYNIISSDKDLVCLDSAYELAKEIAEFLNGVFIELDSENKIYRVVLEDKKNYFDIAQAINNDVIADVKRRDFTINSIFYDLNKKEIFDPVNGINDIKSKILKTYDLKNFIDDPLRMLRLFRFYSYTGFEIEENLSDFVKNNFHLITNVAYERVNYEILKIFEGAFLVETLLKMYDWSVLEIIFPFVSEIKKIPSNSHHHLDLIHHSIETVKNIRINKPMLKLAAFYHDIGKPSTWTIEPETNRHRFIGHDIEGSEIVKKELEKLKFSNKQILYISKMVKHHIYPAALMNCSDNEKNIKKAYARFIRKLGEDVEDVIELARADRLSALGEAITKEMVENSLNHLSNLLNYYNEVKNIANEPKTLLNGNEIMEILNIKPSKMLGNILEELKEAQISGEITDKKSAIEYIKKCRQSNF